MSTSIRLAALLVGLAFPLPAMALCALCSCSVSTTNVGFGAYDPTAPTADDVTGNISINCVGVAALLGSIDVTLSPGISGAALARQHQQGEHPAERAAQLQRVRAGLWPHSRAAMGRRRAV